MPSALFKLSLSSACIFSVPYCEKVFGPWLGIGDALEEAGKRVREEKSENELDFKGLAAGFDLEFEDG